MEVKHFQLSTRLCLKVVTQRQLYGCEVVVEKIVSQAHIDLDEDVVNDDSIDEADRTYYVDEERKLKLSLAEWRKVKTVAPCLQRLMTESQQQSFLQERFFLLSSNHVGVLRTYNSPPTKTLEIALTTIRNDDGSYYFSYADEIPLSASEIEALIGVSPAISMHLTTSLLSTPLIQLKSREDVHRAQSYIQSLFNQPPTHTMRFRMVVEIPGTVSSSMTTAMPATEEKSTSKKEKREIQFLVKEKQRVDQCMKLMKEKIPDCCAGEVKLVQEERLFVDATLNSTLGQPKWVTDWQQHQEQQHQQETEHTFVEQKYEYSYCPPSMKEMFHVPVDHWKLEAGGFSRI